VDVWTGSNWRPGDLAMALYGGLYAYSGWDILNYGTDEIQRPRRYFLFKNKFCLIKDFFVIDFFNKKS
jgi:hypothetical protein